MTVQVDILTLGFLIVTIILAAFLLPMIWQMKKTAQEADSLLGELRRGLPSALRDLQETMERVNRITAKFEKGVDKSEDLVETLNDITGSIRHISIFLRQDMYRYAEIAGYLMVGFKAASKVFSHGAKQKETKS
jgi:uncharacterized protein YoxC